jgi:hypothetical protein
MDSVKPNFMDTFKQWTISKKIFSLSIGGTAITLLLGILAIVSFTFIDSYSTRLNEAYIPELEFAADV